MNFKRFILYKHWFFSYRIIFTQINQENFFVRSSIFYAQILVIHQFWESITQVTCYHAHSYTGFVDQTLANVFKSHILKRIIWNKQCSHSHRWMVTPNYSKQVFGVWGKCLDIKVYIMSLCWPWQIIFPR